MTPEESEKLVELEYRLRKINREFDSDDIGEVADQIRMIAKPIKVVYPKDKA